MRARGVLLRAGQKVSVVYSKWTGGLEICLCGHRLSGGYQSQVLPQRRKQLLRLEIYRTQGMDFTNSGHTQVNELKLLVAHFHLKFNKLEKAINIKLIYLHPLNN